MRSPYPPERCYQQCTDPDYIEEPKKPGLGDWTAKGLARFGVKQKPGCPCPKRIEWLNKAGDATLAYFRRLLGRG